MARASTAVEAPRSFKRVPRGAARERWTAGAEADVESGAKLEGAASSAAATRFGAAREPEGTIEDAASGPAAATRFGAAREPEGAVTDAAS
ncbi:MAG: hypothetical protein RL846_35630 [Deltaproteobacteria bacterium]